MIKSSYMNIKEYYEYLDFIKECKNKIYDNYLVTHRHHIIPTHIEQNNNPENIVIVSVEDHIQCHYLLSKCYEVNSYENLANLYSCRRLKSSITIKTELDDLIIRAYIGENNPFYNKKHTAETRKILSEKTTNNVLNNSSYDIRYADPDLERKKRSEGVKKYWSNISENDKLERSKKLSKSLKGKTAGSKNGMTYPVLINGIRYECKNDAVVALGVPGHKLHKLYSIIRLDKNKK